jgi:hypothetical protein
MLLLRQLKSFFFFSYSSQSEKSYCENLFRIDRERIQKIVLVMSCFLHSIGTLAIFFVMPDPFKMEMVYLHFLLAFVQLTVLVTKIVPYHAIVTVTWQILICGYLMIMWTRLGDPLYADYIAPASAFIMGLHAMFIVLAPFYFRNDSFGIMFNLLAIVFVYQYHEMTAVFATAFFGIDIWAFGYRRFMIISRLDTFKKDYRYRSQVLPRNIIHKSLYEDNLQAAFPPQERTGVFISSDWRNFQKLSGSMSANDISNLLGDYYTMCEDLLDRIFPDGDYYMDWIADELFVVVFCEFQTEVKERINLAVKFSVELLGEKKKFFSKFSIEQGIDVGVAFGKAQIGMMGPSTHLKATALGQLPGRARRLQSCGKQLRKHLGDCDRVVLDTETLLMLSKPFEINEWLLKAKLEDIEDEKVFYIQNS